MFVKRMREFYDSQGIKEEKTIVFSDSLDVELCLKYNKAARDAGFNVSFGVGTFLTSEFPSPFPVCLSALDMDGTDTDKTTSPTSRSRRRSRRRSTSSSRSRRPAVTRRSRLVIILARTRAIRQRWRGSSGILATRRRGGRMAMRGSGGVGRSSKVWFYYYYYNYLSLDMI